MPEPSTIALFVTTTVALLIMPGPTTALVLARSLSDGARVTRPLVLGVGLGDLVAGSVSLAGAGALLAASAAAFTVVKLVGALYLIWLGIRLFRAAPAPPDITAEPPAVDAVGTFRDGFLVTVFNPKGILFFVAFVPQFIDVERDYAPQAACFVLLFVVLGMLTCTVYALGANALRGVLRSARVLRAMNRAGGTAIAAAGVAAAFAKRPVA